MKNSFLHTVSLVLIFLSVSCTTDDVDGPPPASKNLTIGSDKLSISESDGLALVTVTLTESSASETVVGLSFMGNAFGDSSDYYASAKTIVIPAGNLFGSITISAVQDTIEEGNESIDIAISSISGSPTNGSQSISIIIEDDDVPVQAQLLLNEMLYDPPDGLAGDANGDGTRDPNDDEFVEIINLSSQEFDISGYKLYDTDAFATLEPRHVFPANTIVPSGKAIVVFGGGTPTGNFGDAIVQTASGGRINLSNAGDEFILTDASDIVLILFDIEPLSNNPNESYTRNPDITGDFEQHAANTSLLYSPGTKIDGSAF